MVQKKIVARSKGIIEVDGLKFKDLDGTGELKPYEDWRLTPEERAKDLVSRMNNEEKARLMVIHDLPMGISTPDGKPTSHNGVLNEQFEEVMRRGMKVMQYPTTLQLASRNMDTIEKFAKIVHDEFYVSNIRKGYMYMADCATDPRWFRTFGTFGEHPDLICDIMPRVIKGIQGETLDENGVAVTTKHFPGGGARENGFDPHYAEGKYNCYNTPGSMDTYHIPAFKASIAAGTSSTMPYYAIPSNKKSGFPQNGVDKFDEEIAFAYNDQFINGFLRNDLGFDGIVNSDTGVMGNCAWGAEMYNQAGRAARILHAGTDMVSGENAADAVVNTEETKAIAYKAHQESIVVLKNQNAVLPLTSEKLEGKKVYVEMMMRTDYSEKELQAMVLSGSAANPKETVAAFPQKIKEDNPQITFVDDYKDADVAVLFLKPARGSYFEATDGYLELNVQKSTGVDVEHIKEIREAVDQVIMHVNLNLPYLLTNVEPLADAVTVGFDSFSRAAFDVIKGEAAPVGKLPITLPGSDAAIAVDENGICASPNDVPGYDKAKYMKDGLTYAYKDATGNEYIYGFGLTY
ncbi:MAG: glycoside hydrolase family 3 C-terminal domain-containing protein [Eubacterium sp.]|nr:glycoside hydrolase family 3 C-terminal domain-containing protein [Eubacterium sp.]